MQKIDISITRDSVCMGDDCLAPHRIEFSILEDSNLEEIFQILKDKSYLASVSGTTHSWTANVFDKPVAVFNGNSEIGCLKSGLSEQLRSHAIEGKMKIHFEYHAKKI